MVRKLVTMSEQAYEHLKKLRDAEKQRLNLRTLTITDFATNLILNQPMPNGNGHFPTTTAPADPVDHTGCDHK